MGPNQWNQTEVEKRRSQDSEQAMNEFDSEIRRVQDLILTLPSEVLHTQTDFPEAPAGIASARWRGSLAYMAAAMTSHYRYHIQRIHQWMASLEAERPLRF